MTEQQQQSLSVLTCDICVGEIEFLPDVEVHELIECPDCGTEYEVVGITPLAIEEAPMIAEDWGQ